MVTIKETIFWDVRQKLLAASSQRPGPFERPADNPLDYAIEGMLVASAVNSRTWKAKGCEGLADHPRSRELAPIVGDGFAPFKEMNAFWVPLAADYALVEDRAQKIRREQFRDGAEPLKALVGELRDVVTKLKKANVPFLAKAWGKSPLKPFHKSAIGIEASFDDMMCALSLESTGDAASWFGATFEDLKTVLKGDKNDIHLRTNFKGAAFTAILAIAWYRVTRSPPTTHAVAFQDLVDASWYAAFGEREAGPSAGVIRNAVEGDIDWPTVSAMSWLVRAAERSLFNLIEESGLTAAQKSALRYFCVREDYLPPDEDTTPWHERLPV